MSTTNANNPNIPLPAGATTCGWDTINTDTGTPERSMQWFEQDAGDVGVNIDGWQQIDGTYTCGISVYGMSEGERITGVQARRLAAALLNAADELYKLNG